MHELNEHVLLQLKEEDTAFPDVVEGVLVPQVVVFYFLSVLTTNGSGQGLLSSFQYLFLSVNDHLS